jgi:hypothetical protein
LGNAGKHPLALGQRAIDCWPEIWNVIKPLIDQVLYEGKSTWAEDQLIPINRNGVLQDVYWTFGYSPVEDDEGERKGVLVTCIETTDKMKNLHKLMSANKALKINEVNLRNMIKHAPVAIGYLRGRELTIETANERILEVWGKSEEVLGKPLKNVLPELDEQPYLKILDDVFTTGVPFSGIEYKAFVIKNGVKGEYFFDFVYEPVTAADGSISGIIIIANDVTEKVHTRKEIEQSEDMLRQIVMKSPFIMLVLKGPDFIVEVGNQALLDYWNKSRDETIGKKLLEVLPELKGQPFPALLQRIIDTGEPYGEEEVLNYFYTEEGTIDKYVTYRYEPLFNSDGTIGRILVAAEDRTQAVHDRNELLRTQENLRLSLEAAELGRFDMDLKKGTMYWDKRCRELFGISHQNKVTYELDFVTGLHPDDRQRITKIIDDLMNPQISDGNYDVEYRTVGVENGIVRWIRAKGKVFFDENRIPARFIGSVLDITENKLDEIRKNDFIGMVSHELKTPLTSLTAIVQVVNSKLKTHPDQFLANALDKANILVKKMAAQINGFLNISRLESGKLLIEKSEFDLNALIVDVIKDIEITVVKHKITYERHGPILVYADAEKISSVISNLISNALKYSPKGTRIEISCETNPDVVQVNVSDEGVGISKKDQEQLFERYYRVNDVRTTNVAGFGIGLYLSAEIVARHGGKIWVESESGAGSTFSFTLPLHELI